MKADIHSEHISKYLRAKFHVKYFEAVEIIRLSRDKLVLLVFRFLLTFQVFSLLL